MPGEICSLDHAHKSYESKDADDTGAVTEEGRSVQLMNMAEGAGVIIEGEGQCLEGQNTHKKPAAKTAMTWIFSREEILSCSTLPIGKMKAMISTMMLWIVLETAM